MKKPLSGKHYAGISLASPFVAVLLILIYQQIAYRDKMNTDFFGFVLIFEWFLAFGIGSLIGLVFAGFSLKKNFSKLGMAAFLLNLFLALYILSIFAK